MAFGLCYPSTPGVKVHSVTGPPSGGGSRDRRSERRGGARGESPTGSSGRRSPSYRPESRGASPRMGLQDPLLCHSHSSHTSPGPTPAHYHACHRAPRGWAGVAPPGASAMVGRDKARCLMGTSPHPPRLEPCLRLSPHTAQHFQIRLGLSSVAWCTYRLKVIHAISLR
jgi:hypothetical protein